MAPDDAAPRHTGETEQAASGRPLGVGHPTYAEAAARLLDNGYEPLPILPSRKVPAVSRWTEVLIDPVQVEAWSRSHGGCGVGLRTGRLVGLDIDVLDPDVAYAIDRLAVDRLGDTLLRVGLWPKRLRLYRTHTPQPKRSIRSLEILGAGQQFVAFGLHEKTGCAYDWPLGETPLEVPFADLPEVAPEDLDAFLAEAVALLPIPQAGRTARSRRSTDDTDASRAAVSQLERDADGRVVDGRDAWLSRIAFHAVHYALDAGLNPDPHALAQDVWERFLATTDLGRPKKGGRLAYDLSDAFRKIGDKIRLHREGRLPARGEEIAAPEVDAGLPVDEARLALDSSIADACARILAFHEQAADSLAPRIGIKATVGLGKSVAARKHLLALRKELAALGAPSRIAVFTPSHALAEEAAAGWAEAGVTTAVHRGYRAIDPRSRAPLCRNLEAVDLAIEAGLDVHTTACDDRNDRRCAFFDGCLKQANRREVAEADIVVAAYDALFTGFAAETSSFGAMLIDEGCWQRARRSPETIALERFPQEGLLGRGRKEKADRALADLAELRAGIATTLCASERGPVRRSDLASLTAEECRLAARLEAEQCCDPGLAPGATPAERDAAKRIVALNSRARRNERFWSTLTRFLEGGAQASGRLRIIETSGENGGKAVTVEGLHRLHPTLDDIPVLHLDATLRPTLAGAVLPRLQMTEIAAATPHMHLSLVTGGFGKSALIESGSAAPEENARRTRKLSAVVEHVAWEARRVAPGRTLV
ncbi:MAG: bifunctional DNA primase/polymerase, partial [Pseudomonadota bacterium]